jgi:hypothetical protein
MAITHGAAARNAFATTYLTRVDVGSTYGKFKVLTSGDTLLATITLPKPSHSVTAAVATILGTPLSGTAVAAGTAAKFIVSDSDDTVVSTGSVSATGGGGDAIIDNTSIAVDQTVRLLSGSWTAPV